MSVPSLLTFFLSVDSKPTPFIVHVVAGAGTPTLLQDNEIFSFQGVTILRLNDVILAGTVKKIYLKTHSVARQVSYEDKFNVK